MLYPRCGDIKKRRTGTRESRNSAGGASVIHQWKIRPSCHRAAGINKLRKIWRGELEELENSTSTRATIAKQTSSSSSRFNRPLFLYLFPSPSFLSAFARRFSKFGEISLFSISCQNYEFSRVTFSSKHWATSRFFQSCKIEDEKRKRYLFNLVKIMQSRFYKQHRFQFFFADGSFHDETIDRLNIEKLN